MTNSAAKKTIPSFALLFLLCWIQALSMGEGNGRYLVRAVEFPEPPRIDGSLDDPFWESAAVLEGFTQYEPREGSDPTEKTVARVGFDNQNLYIAIRCYDSNPQAVRACLTQRDKVMGDDEVVVYLDTFNDKKRAFAFLVNPCGVQSDGIYNESQRRRPGSRTSFDRIDRNWDTFFLSDARIDDEGYSVELAIPFKSLRFPKARTQVWGFQIKRNIRRKNEEIYWHPRSRNINGFLIQVGRLQIDSALAQGRNLEVMPVLTGIHESGSKFNPQPSLNLKYGISSDLTADLTLNPDFSQIEADMPQIEVNQRYTVYYPEKRPFFLEGKDFFDTPMEMVYTRTIPNPMWGAKLTGKFGRTTLGFLSAYGEDPPNYDIPYLEEKTDDEIYIADRSFVNILRLKYDLYPESHVGLIMTDKETGGRWKDISSNSNRMMGVDAEFKFLDYNRFSLQVAGSSTRVGDEYDSGFVPAVNMNLQHQSRRWQATLEYTHLPPDFEAASGYFRRKDIRQIRSRLGYSILPMNDLIVDIRPSLEYRRAYDFNGNLADEEIQLGGFITGWRGTFLYGAYSWEFERYEEIDFRHQGLRLRLHSEPFKWFNGGLNFSRGSSIYYDDNPYLGYKLSYGITGTLKPLSNLRMYYNYDHDTFWKSKGGDVEYKINIISQRITWQITRSISLRVITDWNDYDEELYNSFLFSYVYRPGTVFYAGIDDNQYRDENGFFIRDSRFYFIKFSYWWRI